MINKLMSQITDFDAWIEEYLGDDRDAVSELVRICATISDNLGGRAQQSRAISKDVDCSKDDEEAFHVYRDGNKAITLLRSVKRLVPAGSTILQKKVFGYICEGNGIPMKYALAGYNDILADDPDFLQSSFWTDQVYQFAQREHVALGSHGYDAKHGKPRGYAHASHVECKLALWYATMCVPGKHLSISAKRTRIWELLKDNVVRRATMYINRAPCGVCMTLSVI